MLGFGAAVPLVGVSLLFLVDIGAVVRVLPSNEWIELTEFVTGPILFVLCAFQVIFFLGNAEKYDAHLHALAEKRGLDISRETLSDKPFVRFLVLLICPFFLWTGYIALILLFAPIATIAVSHQKTTHEYIVEYLRLGSNNRKVLILKGFNWSLGGISYPPAWLWNEAQPGDMIRLSGTGNRWGVFYDEIELIKRE